MQFPEKFIHRISLNKSFFQNLFPKIYNNHIFYIQSSDLIKLCHSIDINGYQIVFPYSGDEIDLNMLRELNLDEYTLRYRLAQGDLLGLIKKGPNIVHRTLVQVNGYARLEGDPKAFLLKDGEIYIHFCETSLPHRGKSLYPMMLVTILRYFQQSPIFKQAFIACNRDNKASISGILRAGFLYKESNRILAVLLGRIRIKQKYIDESFRQ